ncbi:glycerophosphodiester phosphodiesterase family protein [Aliikangiella coralliicola]|uniref:glycerophosphodiester phosphodiesterase n=1 Tax=Aliikangiella coralliicola TaxID=2592383 RepID=A0A545U658_9GAMM|nr:glycerophosphodiester phosphodiesterase family protein [Aliikangiella coralliicola]TQV84961.1 glycerophosphodiester phosphodiesterase [Aliikangiella coralliicola]
MNKLKSILGISALTIFCSAISTTASATSLSDKHSENHYFKHKKNKTAQIGPRPYYLVEDMDLGYLKSKLQHCANKKRRFKKTDFSIGHRGAPMQFPEHTKESYVAAARMGAGILECDVTFTKDRELVCRHAQCDLHTTTNILETPLAAKCSQPFSPATFDVDGNLLSPASVRCCASDITLAEFKTLKGKMDAGNSQATNVEEYMDATAGWRTDLYTQNGTLLSHAESIELFKSLGVKMTPELKSPSVEMPYEGDYTQEEYAQQMINEYKLARVKPKNVFPQSFNLDDVKYWIENEPRFGKQAVYLDDRYDDPTFDFRDPATWSPTMEELAADGVQIVAPPMWMLIDLNSNNKIVPSAYAKSAKNAGLDIITWTLERSGPLASGGGWYYQSVTPVINNDGDMLKVLDVLAKDVGVLGVFSDWPATVSYYANCRGLK